MICCTYITANYVILFSSYNFTIGLKHTKYLISYNSVIKIQSKKYTLLLDLLIQLFKGYSKPSVKMNDTYDSEIIVKTPITVNGNVVVFNTVLFLL